MCARGAGGRLCTYVLTLDGKPVRWMEKGTQLAVDLLFKHNNLRVVLSALGPCFMPENRGEYNRLSRAPEEYKYIPGQFLKAALSYFGSYSLADNRELAGQARKE